ncbi:UNVERIFIED_CONTAM: hypothetical protein FKN15_011627 [Acipenser sinensis]
MLSARSPLSSKNENAMVSNMTNISLTDKENTPPSMNTTRILASKTARRIFEETEYSHTFGHHHITAA